MRKIREVLRLRFECGRSYTEIAASAAIGETTVHDYLRRARAASFTWEMARELTDAEVDARLFTGLIRSEPPARVAVDFGWVRRQRRLRSRTGRSLAGAAQDSPSAGSLSLSTMPIRADA